ncbi:MAG: methionine synthase [Promethearchaeota archaeon]|nr:MAG: methionine synthase [Candidatus Lokiarchaeota archaeon]
MASINPCVHVAGVYNFKNIAEKIGFDTIFLGPSTLIGEIIEKIKELTPSIVGLSYRLTPSTLEPSLKKFFKEYKKLKYKPNRLFFAGTAELFKTAKRFKMFDVFFTGGESKYDIISVLREGKKVKEKKRITHLNLIERIKWKKPFPVIRSHYGRPSLKKTIQGIKRLSDEKVLDIISIAPDQNTQQNFFHPKDRIKEFSGAGGVPLRCREDFQELDRARLRGNYPLLRIYAGTRDFIKLAQMYDQTIKNAWGAIPIFWFNQMDGRGPLDLKTSIHKHLKAIKWYGTQNIPLEINDSHHWSLRNAPDAIAVADMYLSGIIAKNLGVKHYIAQYMFNTPPNLSHEMDLAKILAMNELLQTITDDSFNLIKQVRTGLASFPIDLDRAKGQLAMSTLIQLSIKPDIVHVVSFSEGKHAATVEDIIESCKIVDHIINRGYSSNLNLIDQRVLKRKNELIEQAKWIINQIPKLAKETSELQNLWTSPAILTRIVKYGIFDAPQLQNNKFAKGEIDTKIIEGTCYSWDSILKKKLDERERITEIFEEHSDCLSLQDRNNTKNNLNEMSQ